MKQMTDPNSWVIKKNVKSNHFVAHENHEKCKYPLFSINAKLLFPTSPFEKTTLITLCTHSKINTLVTFETHALSLCPLQQRSFKNHFFDFEKRHILRVMICFSFSNRRQRHLHALIIIIPHFDHRCRAT